MFGHIQFVLFSSGLNKYAIQKFHNCQNSTTPRSCTEIRCRVRDDLLKGVLLYNLWILYDILLHISGINGFLLCNYLPSVLVQRKTLERNKLLPVFQLRTRDN